MLLIYFALHACIVLASTGFSGGLDEKTVNLLEHLSDLETRVSEMQPNLEIIPGYKVLDKERSRCTKLLFQLKQFSLKIHRLSLIKKRNMELIEVMDEDILVSSVGFQSRLSEGSPDLKRYEELLEESREATRKYFKEYHSEACSIVLADLSLSVLQETVELFRPNLIRLATEVVEKYQLLHDSLVYSDPCPTFEKRNLTQDGFIVGETVKFPLVANYDQAREIANRRVSKHLDVVRPKITIKASAEITSAYNIVRCHFDSEDPRTVEFILGAERDADMHLPKITNIQHFRVLLFNVFRIACVMQFQAVILDLSPFCSNKVLPLIGMLEAFRYFREAFSADYNAAYLSLGKVRVVLSPAYLAEYRDIQNTLAKARIE